MPLQRSADDVRDLDDWFAILVKVGKYYVCVHNLSLTYAGDTGQ